MTTLIAILRPDFLLRDALIGSVLVGMICPLVGVYFVLRRMIFLGVALPQLSAAGIAFSFLLYRALVGQHQHLEMSERVLALLGSFCFALGGLLILAALARHRETVEGRIGITYAVATAATILFVAADPYGEAHMIDLLKGDILTAPAGNLLLLTAVFGSVALILLGFRRELLLVSFDRDLAVVFGMRTGLWDTLLYFLIGVTISFGVLTAGPIVTFGFLVVPPLTARLVTRHMLTFSLVAAGLGGATALVGFYCAYRFDLPLGPAQVAVASVVLLVIAAADAVRRALERKRTV